MVRVLVLVVLGTLVLSAADASAGRFYLHEDDRYYWFMREGAWEVAVPAGGEAYLQRHLLGEQVLDIMMTDEGPLMRMGILDGDDGDVPGIWNALQGAWSHRFANAAETENRTITTGVGLSAEFRVVQGETPQGAAAMLRAVFFSQADTLVYLAFVGETGQYQGDVREQWLRMVNSFDWQ